MAGKILLVVPAIAAAAALAFLAGSANDGGPGGGGAQPGGSGAAPPGGSACDVFRAPPAADCGDLPMNYVFSCIIYIDGSDDPPGCKRSPGNYSVDRELAEKISRDWNHVWHNSNASSTREVDTAFAQACRDAEKAIEIINACKRESGFVRCYEPPC